MRQFSNYEFKRRLFHASGFIAGAVTVVLLTGMVHSHYVTGTFSLLGFSAVTHDGRFYLTLSGDLFDVDFEPIELEGQQPWPELLSPRGKRWTRVRMLRARCVR